MNKTENAQIPVMKMPISDHSGQPPAELVSMLQSYPDPAVLLSADYEILSANAAYRQSYGDVSVTKRHCYEVSHHYDRPCDQMGESCPMLQCMQTNKAQRVFHLHHTPNGEEHVDVELYPVEAGKGEVRYFLEVMRYSKLASPRAGGQGLIGRSSAFIDSLALIERVASSETTVLLLGESGTGKELMAQAVHQGSLRSQNAFVPVECSGLTETLFESELFGHEKGAFTGAHSRKTGLVEAAKGGTLFLDEVGDIPLSLQVKLLRLLETGTYRRVGGVEPLKADFRLVCATHRNLDQQVADGEFRMDLYYRINAFPVVLPPLRERVTDIPLLVDSFLPQFSAGREIKISQEALRLLQAYQFPGNIRELRNILERACLLVDDHWIESQHLPVVCKQGCSLDITAGSTEASRRGSGFYQPNIVGLEQLENRYLLWALAQLEGDKALLAHKVGVSERTLYRKLKSA
ncbi:sigma-54 interaction domain-containing protein [Oceanospirillum linum]|uniref:Fis family transcriptional regulator n=1 Tax=Oceanospirillum linum TaxID=966 RepID=A0A1T1HEJ0_OCELI|nr:sigma-54-dependent Fis family transcriptional regulator [Oceanospirillum linum]OOV88222.1 Fis family transcriptional regulator [Oceanospirillum linum]SEF48636.1 Transcriptional regulator containing PAS, AAA-type ATPase, and DNA-binding Fis domains [Oleiphilus messinensis]SMP03003.1 sigma54 specific transcriptional regulator, Fis family [Oceanospirillum linum]